MTLGNIVLGALVLYAGWVCYVGVKLLTAEEDDEHW